MTTCDKYYVGIDVGTQSVRAGLVTFSGKIVKSASLPIKTWNPFPDEYEQSSDNIWKTCVNVVKTVCEGIDSSLVKGIGFDATCSLVMIGKDLKPLSVSKSGNSEQNIILWMDHRAVKEANFINSLSHPVLKYVGGKISPEMEPPKLLWIKKNLPSQWTQAGYFFDLPDFLTWKATKSLTRSLCSLVCKWTYQAGDKKKQGWQDDFWKDIGLEDLIADNYQKIGTVVLSPGEACGNGLCADAANEMNLLPGTPVATSIIDAHAGGIGILSCSPNDEMSFDLENRVALISGTSTCHMKINKYPIFTHGVWGPYFSAMVPGYWSSEAGQSAAGVLLDHIIKVHPATMELRKNNSNRHITDVLNEEIDILKEKRNLSSKSRLTEDFHVWPDYHGNRSPLADSGVKGMICGLTLAHDTESLSIQYLATVQALAYGTKHIISCMEKRGHKVELLLICGGLAKNPLYIQMHADVTGLPVVIPHESESVLLGSAMLGATAAKDYPSVISAMAAMCGSGLLIKPNKDDKSYHEKKYEVFLELMKCQKKAREIMMN